MNIYIRDDENKLTDEIAGLMNDAIIIALRNEFGDSVSFEQIKELPIELSVSIVSNEEIKNLNNEFRSIDKVTDVLSFPQYATNDDLKESISTSVRNFSDNSSFGILLGDVVICFDRAFEQANEYATGIKRELVYLFVHSVFHLFGYDHMNDDEKKVMRKKEDQVMEELGL